MPETAQEPLSIPPAPVSRHGRVTAVSMMKDEGPYLLEWVAHHLAVGFTDLVVYTNDCSDGTDTMLMRLEDLGLAHHRRNDIPAGLKPQPSALKYAQNEPLVQNSDWVLVFDADEFLCIKYGDGSLDRLIDAIKAEDANGIVITWRIFGSGGIENWSRDFVTEQYLMAAPPMWNKGWGVKTLFQFDAEKWKLGIHRPKMKNKMLDTGFSDEIRWLNGSGREMEEYFKFRGWRSIVRTVGYDWAQMNHYAVKSVDSYAIRKFRGNVNNKTDKYNDDYWALQDRNEVRDVAMLRYSAQRRAIFEALLKDPVLHELHHDALAGVEARLADLKESPDYGAFVDQLRAASTVPITQVQAKPPKERDKHAIAAKMKEVEKRAAFKRAKEKSKPSGMRAMAPVDIYVRDIVDMKATPPLEFFANQSIEVPADPRLFTPPALIAITEGKFERNLARLVARRIPEDGHYVDIGATSGFLGAHLAKDRPDRRVTLIERDENLRVFIERLCDHNGLNFTDRLSLREIDSGFQGARITELLMGMPAAMVNLADPQLSLDSVAAILTPLERKPQTLAVSGRLWSNTAHKIADWDKLVRPLGYGHRLPADSAFAAVYGHGDPPQAAR